MTDNEIIKALECCASQCEDACDDCPCVDGKCIATTDYVLDLINRLQAENEAEIERLKKGWKADVIETQNIKADAIKECIKKVKEEINEALKSNYKAKEERFNRKLGTICDFEHYCNGKIDCLRGLDDFCDNLLKEMVGEE